MKKRVLSFGLGIILALSLVLPAIAAGGPADGHHLDAGSYVSAYITDSGGLYTCGQNNAQQLGYQSTNSENSAGPIQNVFTRVMDDVTAVSFGGSHTAAIRSDGSLWTWGSNYYGQLGFENGGQDQSTPKKVMDDVAQVSCGRDFTAAVKTDGSLWTWGNGWNGQLGTGMDEEERTQPQHVLDDVAQVSCGGDFTAAIKTDGSLWVWGGNANGQLGIEPVKHGSGLMDTRIDNQLTPQKILDSGAAYVECGLSCTALIKTDGSLWTWGNNSSGQLGNGTQESTYVPQHILDNVVQVSLSGNTTSTAYAVQADGTLLAWGSNQSDFLGFAGEQFQTTPRRILDGVAEVASGGIHTIALKTDGSLWAWGYDNGGAQGRGSNLATCYFPGKVLDNVLAVSEAESGHFTDVNVSDYFADAVDWAVAAGVTQGTGVGVFSPGATVTRAEAVTFLWRAAGEPAPSATVSSFSDVTDPDAYYYSAVLWAVERDITKGVGGGRFNLTGTLAYDQFLAFLCRAAGESTGGANWSAAAVDWARESGLTDGLNFPAEDSCPRADVVYFLWKQAEAGGGLSGESDQGGTLTTGLLFAQGIEADLIRGLMGQQAAIDVSEYGLSAQEALSLANSIAHVDGKNVYRITSMSCTPASGTAKQLNMTYEDGLLSVSADTDPEARAAATAIVAQVVTPDMSDYDKIKALHDYLVLHCAYEPEIYGPSTGYLAYQAFGALGYGAAVCDGYSRAFEMLMDAAGIPCLRVTGYVSSGYHGWNLVQLDGEWYHVDTTWDDPTPDREGYIRYDYFLKSDSYMSRDHYDWDQKQTCDSTRYDSLNLPDSFE